jgi:hypothetical protein
MIITTPTLIAPMFKSLANNSTISSLKIPNPRQLNLNKGESQWQHLATAVTSLLKVAP